MSVIEFNYFLNRLPYEIYLMIRRLTYLKQNKILLEDINHFYSSLRTAYKLYYNTYRDNFDLDPKADINWLSNDIDIYLNDNHPLMRGYIDKYYNTLLRLKYFQIVRNNEKNDKRNKLVIEKYLNFLNLKSVDKHIRVLWGLLKPKERNEMLEMFYPKLEIENTYNEIMVSHLLKI